MIEKSLSEKTLAETNFDFNMSVQSAKGTLTIHFMMEPIPRYPSMEKTSIRDTEGDGRDLCSVYCSKVNS